MVKGAEAAVVVDEVEETGVDEETVSMESTEAVAASNNSLAVSGLRDCSSFEMINAEVEDVAVTCSSGIVAPALTAASCSDLRAIGDSSSMRDCASWDDPALAIDACTV
jgi:hypothetical protein